MDKIKATRKEVPAIVAEKVMGWEFVTVGYRGHESETQWQRDHRSFMEQYDMRYVGDYFIVNYDKGIWMEAKDFNPLDNDNPRHMFEMLRQFPTYAIGQVSESSFVAEVYYGGESFVSRSKESEAVAAVKACLLAKGIELEIVE